MNVAKQYPVTKTHVNKEPSWFVVILMSGIISGILLFAVGWYISLPQAQKDVVVQKIMSAGDIFPGMMGLSKPKILLVMGVDMAPNTAKSEYHQVRTDTMMLVKMDTARKQVNIVSIPRDSKVFIARGHGVNKINAAFTLGGPELAVETVEQTFGVDIDNYAVLNIRGVREFVDALDGVELFVEKPLRYTDRSAGLHIDLQPGHQRLNGEQAEGFVRFRNDALGDIGRIRRQQQFIAAVVHKIKSPNVLLKIKPLLTASNKYMLTNMSTQDIISMALFAKDLNFDDIQVATLPGRPSMNTAISYWIIEPQPAEEVLNRMIVGIQQDMRFATGDVPTVGILYTPGHSGEIAPYKGQLETSGFRVICNMQLRRSSTKLVTHSSGLDRQSLESLKQSNGALRNAQLIFSPHGATFETNSCGHSDYTIILGEDTRSAVNQ